MDITIALQPLTVMQSLLHAACFLSCVFAFIGITPQAPAADQRNVLFIAIDDLKPALGCYGDAHAQTPNLDRLASRSLRLDRAYCNQAVCSPSRNALMTGLRPETLGIYDLTTNFRDSWPDAVTLAQHFKNNGFTTASIGKIYHTGHGNRNDPASWSDKPIHPKTDYYALPENRPPAGASVEGKDQRGSPTEAADVPDDTYEDGLIAAEAVKRLAALKKAQTPFFLAVGFRCPHLPFVAPKKYWDRFDPSTLPVPASDALPDGAPEAAGPSTDELRKYKGIPPGKEVLGEAQKRHLIHGYYAATSYADACVGRVLDALESSGLAEHTIIVVWGDHGYHLGDHGIWGKHTNYELAARIPLMVAVPGRKGSVSSALVETVDIYPTLAALTGLPAPTALDGQSFAALIDNPSAPHRDHITHVFPRRELLGRAIRDDRYRLVEWKKIGASPETATFELYDYQTDPLEHHNLAPEQPEQLARLKARLATHPEAKPQITAKPMAAATATSKMSREEMFKGKDKDNDGKLTQEEFLRHQRDPDEAPKRFNRFDTNHDGVLTQDEFIKGAAPSPKR